MSRTGIHATIGGTTAARGAIVPPPRPARLGALLALMLAIPGCANPCVNTVLARHVSPDGASEAVLFARDCGATTRVSTQISLIEAGAEPTGAGNLFVADRGEAEALADWGGPWADIEWLPDDPAALDGAARGRLVVMFDADSRVFTRVERLGDVAVDYESRAFTPSPGDGAPE